MRTFPSRPPSSCVQPAGSAIPVDEEGLAGADDPIVAARCQVEARVLFTLDLDFADIRATRRPSTSASSYCDQRNPVGGKYSS
jgi:hypothetical protein